MRTTRLLWTWAGLAAGLAASSAAAVAQPLTQAVAACRALAEPIARLACYDAIAQPAASSQTLPAPAAPAAVKPVAALPAASPAATPLAPVSKPSAATPPPSDFGLPQVRLPSPTEMLESRIAGRFEGWDPGTRLKLANGQVWEVLDTKRVSYELDNPTVRIKRGMLGSFFMEIDGVSATPRVRRVQ